VNIYGLWYNLIGHRTKLIGSDRYSRAHWFAPWRFLYNLEQLANDLKAEYTDKSIVELWNRPNPFLAMTNDAAVKGKSSTATYDPTDGLWHWKEDVQPKEAPEPGDQK
jgi:hypothetical protein